MIPTILQPSQPTSPLYGLPRQEMLRPQELYVRSIQDLIPSMVKLHVKDTFRRVILRTRLSDLCIADLRRLLWVKAVIHLPASLQFKVSQEVEKTSVHGRSMWRMEISSRFLLLFTQSSSSSTTGSKIADKLARYLWNYHHSVACQLPSEICGGGGDETTSIATRSSFQTSFVVH